MKLLLLVCFCLPVLLSAQKLEAFSRKAMNIQGNVTSFSESLYLFDEDDQLEDQPYKTITYHFNRQGQLVKKEVMLETDLFQDNVVYTYSYDQEGRLTRIIGVGEEEYFSYTKDGSVTTRKTTGTYHETDYFKSDYRGRVKEWKNFTGKEEKFYKKQTFVHNEESLVSQTRQEGGIEDGIRYSLKYNSNGDISKTWKYENVNDFVVSESYVYEYDSRNNWTYCRQTSKNKRDLVTELVIKRKYSYGNSPLTNEEASSDAAFVGSIPLAELYFFTGLDYYNGNGVAVNYKEAMKWYKKSAELGDKDAMKRIAFMYQEGNGVDVDLSESFRWYKLAADKGDGYAMRKLGERYETGLAVEQDYKEAMSWYRRAAVAGDIQAKVKIGLMYKDGKGVPADKNEARKWFSEAARVGSTEAAEALKNL